MAFFWGGDYFFFLHHNIVYSKSPVYNNLNGPGAHIKGPCFTTISLLQGWQMKIKIKSPLKNISYSFVFTFHHNIHN